MRYNREQRKSIYADALEILSGADYDRFGRGCFACQALESASDDIWTHVPDDFPEAYAFRYKKETHVWLSDGSDETQPDTREGNEFRQLVLIFAAELCDDKDFQRELNFKK
jgi:hypothetical protein